ncbi:MAG: metal ABC transporter permease [Clostridiaceae bacterium]|nr:metal ABC transporter permease [Clostridiaceae bacterium]
MFGFFGEDFILNYVFMQKAFIIGIFVAVTVPSIGLIIVLRRLSMIGDSLSHNSLAGVEFGLIAGINPLLGAALFSVAAALGIEKLRKAYPKYSEISIAIILSAGVGLAGILSGFVKNGVSIADFLFGSIITITDFELYMVVVLSVVVIFALAILSKELFYITFDEEAARLSGVPVRKINYIFIVMTAITIAVSSKIVGILVISSLMVLPAASAIQLSKSYRQTTILSVIFGLVAVLAGLTLSYYLDIVPGGTIVSVSVILLLSVLVYKNIIRNILLKKSLQENRVNA